MPDHSDRYEVVVIGAGQAGLAIGHYLAAQGRRFLILEREDDVAPAWRDRWDSLTLFTPRRYDSLPGLAFPGDPDGYPGRDEVVAYLREYATAFDLPVRPATGARSLARAERGFVIGTAAGDLAADQVVVATGAFQEPRVPGFAGGLADDVVQLHSTRYRNPSDLPAGRTLVVGGGNTGYQIAQELASSRETHLAVGTRQAPLPQRLLGRDAFWWLTKAGLIDKSVETRLGRKMSGKETLVGSRPSKIKRCGVKLHGRALGAAGRTVSFAAGGSLEVDGVVWATGFGSDHAWIGLPVTDVRGRVMHKRGVTSVPGLYMLGLQWQYTRGSALLGFVNADAAFIAARIAEHAAALPDSEPAAPAAEITNAAQGD
jgi:putative flavoprotein involved in K+ transport